MLRYLTLPDVLQASLNNLQAEVQQLKDNSVHSKKRVFEMMMSLLKDLGDIGTVVGGNASEFKVQVMLFSVWSQAGRLIILKRKKTVYLQIPSLQVFFIHYSHKWAAVRKSRKSSPLLVSMSAKWNLKSKRLYKDAVNWNPSRWELRILFRKRCYSLVLDFYKDIYDSIVSRSRFYLPTLFISDWFQQEIRKPWKGVKWQ